jgi:3-dehydroquinate dehydratase-2
MSGRPVVLLLNGVNLDLLGERQPLIYGKETLDDHVAATRRAADGAGFDLEHLQSNHEGELVEAVHAARGRCAGIVVNAAAFTHYSWALHDALKTFEGPVIEVHISNPYARESWRQTSVVSPVATGVISGLGGHGYVLAIEALARLLDG